MYSSCIVGILIYKTQRRQYEGHFTSQDCYTDQGLKGRGQYDHDGQVVYCSLIE